MANAWPIHCRLSKPVPPLSLDSTVLAKVRQCTGDPILCPLGLGQTWVEKQIKPVAIAQELGLAAEINSNQAFNSAEHP